MPTVEDYFDDETDIPLPTASGSKPRGLQGQGLQGALLEEISQEDPSDDLGFDYDRLAEDGRGVFGENARAPPPSSQAADPSGKGKVAVRDSDQELRPAGGGGQNKGMMGGFMGDMMRMQQLEEERLEKLRKQFGSATIAADPSVYKEWNSLYPLYFDAKVSVSRGRRVAREKGLWWPQAQHISYACRSLGLQSCLEPNRTHPADFENPGRVKVQFQKDGKFLNPIIKNRTQLYNKLAEQMMREYPKLAYLNAPAIKPKPKPLAEAKQQKVASKKAAKAKGKGKKAATTTAEAAAPLAKRLRTRPPPPPPQSLLPLDQRLPLHSPLAETGIAVSSIKRDLETEKENKKKGITGGGAGGGDEGAGAGGGGAKQPKMKRVVVRGKR